MDNPRGEAQLIVHLMSKPDGHNIILEERNIAMRPSSPAGLGLTARQAEVLAYVADGKTNAEIGTIFGISSRTVEKHVEQIFHRLGVETRTAAAALALDAARSSAHAVR